MIVSRRAFALAVAIHASILAGAASAQTVAVTRAPADGTVELHLNGTRIGTQAPSPTGEATFAVNLKETSGREEMDARLYLDSCQVLRRVQIVERGLEPPALDPGCRRKELIALFVLRTITSLVVDASEANPDAWLRQGAAPSSWLKTTPEEDRPIDGRSWRQAPTGMLLYGGGGLAMNSDTQGRFCGNAENCSGSSYRPAIQGGGTFWLFPHLAVDGSYLKYQSLRAESAEATYGFASELSSHIITAAGKIGGQAGPLRIYGFGGMNYQYSQITTVQKTADTTITANGETTLYPGGTQTLQYWTKGWGWLFGGGVEGWVTPRLGIYGEFTRLKLNGSDTRGGEGRTDDQATVFMCGVRFALMR